MKLAKQILAVGLTAVLLAGRRFHPCAPTGTAELTIDPQRAIKRWRASA